MRGRPKGTASHKPYNPNTPEKRLKELEEVGILFPLGKWIDGLVGKYSITVEGTIYSYCTNSPRPMQQFERDGKLYIRLYAEDGELLERNVEKLVALHYDTPIEGEEWIKDYEGLYSITPSGVVYSHKHGRKKLTPVRHKSGRYSVSLCKDGLNETFYL